MKRMFLFSCLIYALFCRASEPSRNDVPYTISFPANAQITNVQTPPMQYRIPDWHYLFSCTTLLPIFYENRPFTEHEQSLFQKCFLLMF